MAPPSTLPQATPPCIALEGIDGAGTTTQLRHLTHWLTGRGIGVVATHQPSNGPVGRLCREALAARPRLSSAALALLFAADRIQHQHDEIDVAKQGGSWVLCDRHMLSSFAYQGLDLPQPWLRHINAQARPPELTLLLDVPVPLAQERMRARGGVTEVFDAQAVQFRVRKAYLDLAQALGSGWGVHVVDGTGSEAEVTSRLVAKIEQLLGPVAASAPGFGNPIGMG